MLGGIIAAATSAIGHQIKGIEARDAEDRAYTKQKELMDKQYELNNKMAEQNQQRAKYMWDYTNFENQKQHLLNANLSPGLFYGGTGAGGQTSGGQGSGVGLGSETGVGFGIQEKALGLQLAGMASQVALNQSQANKNNAEANKIKGIDTEVQKATMENLIAQTSNEKIKKGLIYADTRLKDAMEEFTRGKVDETGWNIKNLMKSLEIAEKNIEATSLDNELKSRTMETNVKQAEETLKNTMADTLVKFSQGRLNKVQAEAMTEQVRQGWSNIAVQMATKEQGWQQLEQQAEKIANDLKLGEKGLDIQQQNVIKDYILGFGQMATQILTTGMKLPGGGAIIKGFGK